MFMMVFINFFVKMVGFYFEYYKNVVILVDRIIELLYFNDVVFFV